MNTEVSEGRTPYDVVIHLCDVMVTALELLFLCGWPTARAGSQDGARQ